MLVLCILSANYAKKVINGKAATITHHIKAVDYKK